MSRWLWLVPDEFLIVIVVVGALGLIVGLVRGVSLGRLVAGILLLVLLGPFVEGLFMSLPVWVSVAALLLLGLSLLRYLLEMLLGKEAAGHVIGTLVVNGGLNAFRLALLPLRGAFWILSVTFRGLRGA